VNTSATRELIGLQRRELMRDKRYFWFALLFPFGMLGIFMVIGKLVPVESGAPDFTKIVIPMALFLAVTSSALTVTAGPLAGMRAKGTLRLLGTTPLSRGRLIYTHVIVRVGMVTAQAVGLLAVALAVGAVSLRQIPGLLGITLLGMAMFGAVGYLLGGRLSSPDAATNIGTLIQLATLFLSGLTFPFALMPEEVVRVLTLLPSTFFADLMLTQIPDATPYHPAWLSVIVVAGTTAAAMLGAIRLFKWDQGEG
jgi:ABC-2 type transport system permease protein